MTKEDLIKAINEFFADTSRSKEETAEGLEEAIEHAENLIEALGC